MIAFLLTVYAAVVPALFKLKLVKPRPYPIAIAILTGILMVGGVMVAGCRMLPSRESGYRSVCRSARAL
jgi:hypothetical protein